MNIGKRIEVLRREKGLNQSELAIKSGICKNAIYNYENNKRTPQIDVLQRIAAALDCSINDICGESQKLDSLGERIKKYRKLKKISQEELSSLSGVPRVSVSRYERGERIPNTDMLQKIANALGVTQSELLGESRKEIEIQSFTDRDLIEELKRRGYIISKIF